jgi:glycosyltransferase involved in cell wall biosynthesis
LIHLHYFLWQVTAYLTAKKHHALQPYDIVHQATYGTYLKSSLLSFLPIPFIWGPLGGGEFTPKSLLPTLNSDSRRKDTLRKWVRNVAEFNPLVRSTLKNTAIAWAATPETAARLRRMGNRSCRVLSSMVWLDEMPVRAKVEAQPRPLRFVSIGRLLGWNGLHLGLQAFAESRLSQDEYWMIGDGPELDALKALAQELGVENQVNFLGKLSPCETIQQLQSADVLVHPSLHDSGGFVCMEAMALGKPVICLDVGGQALQVNEETGYCIQPNSPKEVRSAIAQAMRELSMRPDIRSRMSQAGVDRIEQSFSMTQWEMFLEALYHDAIVGLSQPAAVQEALLMRS